MRKKPNQFSSIQEALHDACETEKDAIALIEVDRETEKERITYQDFEERAFHFQGHLKKYLSKNHDFKCAIIMQNQSKWLISAYAIFLSGGILVPLDYKLPVQDLLKLLAHAQVPTAITEYHYWQEFIAIDPEINKKIHFIVTDAPEGADLKGSSRWSQEKISEEKYIASKKPNDIACIVYSSGTSGHPKGCLLTHQNYLFQSSVIMDLFPLEKGATFFSILPTNHAIDFMFGFLVSFFSCATVVHQRTLRPEFLFSTLQKYHIESIILVPVLLKKIKEKVEASLDGLSGLNKRLLQFLIMINRLVTKKKPHYKFSRFILAPIHAKFGGKLNRIYAGGAFVDPQVAQFFYDLGIPVIIGYGLTEACTVTTVNDLNAIRPDTVGKPIKDVSVHIEPIQGSVFGEVWIKGPHVMKGYYNEPELTANTLIDGWLHTGDMGYIEQSTGHLKLVGRVKNMIVTSGGKNVYPEEIENVFENIKGIDEIAIFSSTFLWKENTLGEERLIGVIRPLEHYSNLIHLIRERNILLPDFKRVYNFLVWDEPFPRTATFKIKREQLAYQVRSAKSLKDVLFIKKNS